MATRFHELLAVLARHGVDHVVIGGVAMVLHGAPINTLDIDIVYRRTDENIDRLLRALEEIDAHFDDLTGRRLRATASLLRLPSPKLLKTKLGRLDVLGELSPEIDWEALSAGAEVLELDGLHVAVASLGHLIAAKERAGRPKDQLHLMHLRALLARRSRG